MQDDSERTEVSFRPGVVPKADGHPTEPLPGQPAQPGGPAEPYPTRPLPALGPSNVDWWRRRGLLVGGIAAAVVVAFAIGLLAGIGGGGGGPGQPSPSPSPPRDSPRQVVQKYIDAETAGRTDEARGYLCSSAGSRDPLANAGGGANAGGVVHWQVGEEHISGHNATVDVDLGVPIVGTVALSANLTDERGQWRLCTILPRSSGGADD